MTPAAASPSVPPVMNSHWIAALALLFFTALAAGCGGGPVDWEERRAEQRAQAEQEAQKAAEQAEEARAERAKTEEEELDEAISLLTERCGYTFVDRPEGTKKYFGYIVPPLMLDLYALPEFRRFSDGRYLIVDRIESALRIDSIEKLDYTSTSLEHWTGGESTAVYRRFKDWIYITVDEIELFDLDSGFYSKAPGGPEQVQVIEQVDTPAGWWWSEPDGGGFNFSYNTTNSEVAGLNYVIDPDTCDTFIIPEWSW